MTTLIRKFLLAALALAAIPAAHAQMAGYGMQYDNVTVWPVPDLRVPVHSSGGAAAAPVRASAQPAPKANARILAQSFPPKKQFEMQQAYLQSMDVYLQIEKKMGWTSRDMAGGLAAFVVGNYMVLNDADVSDEAFQAVAKQLRREPGMQALVSKQDAVTLRDTFEQSAMVGTFMALAYKSAQQTPQPPAVQQNLRNAARENLKLVLRTDPATVQIDNAGIHLR